MDHEYKKRVSAGRKLHEKARQFRGRFLNTVACIERDIAIGKFKGSGTIVFGTKIAW